MTKMNMMILVYTFILGLSIFISRCSSERVLRHRFHPRCLHMSGLQQQRQTQSTSTPYKQEIKSGTFGTKSTETLSASARARKINQKIIETFSLINRTEMDINNLKTYLQENEKYLNQINIMTLMHRCGKYKQQESAFAFVGVDVALRLLSVKTSKGTAQGIANALYGMQIMNETTPGALPALVLLEEQLKACNELFDGQALSNALYGLRSMTSNSVEVRNILATLSDKIQREGGNQYAKMTPQGVGSAFFGLQGMSSEWPEVRKLLLSLSKVISQESMTTALDSQAFANVLIGLRSSSSDYPEVREVLQALSSHLERGNVNPIETMKSNEFSMALGGLQGMSSSESAVVRLLRIFNDGLEKRRRTTFSSSSSRVRDGGSSINTLSSSSSSSSSSSRHLNPLNHTHPLKLRNGNELGAALGGMKHMSSDNEQVRRMLDNICLSLPKDPESLKMFATEQNIANSLYGLQNMSCTYPEVRKTLRSLTNILGLYQGPLLSGRSVSTALYGLQGMTSDCIEVKKLLRALLNILDPLANDYTGQHIAMACYGLQKMRGGAEVDEVVFAIAQAIETTSHEMTPSQVARSVFGLQSMSAEQASVRCILSKLSHKMSQRKQSLGSEIFLTGRDIAMIMHGLRNLGSEWVEVQNMLSALSSGMKSAGQNLRMNGNELSTSINGLQSMGGGKPLPPSLQTDLSRLSSSTAMFGFNMNAGSGTSLSFSRRRYRLPESLLEFLDCLVEKLESRTQRLNGPMIASALYGLQGLSSYNSAIRKMLYIFSEDLTDQSVELDSKNIGNALYGLQNMTSRSKPVLKLLASLANVIEKSPHPLSAQAIGNAFYGLQGMSSDKEEVRSIVKALSKKMIPVNSLSLGNYSSPSSLPYSCHPSLPSSPPPNSMSSHYFFKDMDNKTKEDYIFTGQNIGNTLWGMRNMTSDHEEIRGALSALAIKIRESRAEMNGQNIGNSLYSLHAMNCNDEAVRQVLAALAIKVLASREPLSGLDIGMSLYGLRYMNSDVADVRILLGTLLYKIKNSDAKLQLRDLSMAILGIMNVKPWIKDDFLKVLANKSGQTLVKGT